jgi:cobalt-zinc-cadmium efflux system outer membrane protein
MLRVTAAVMLALCLIGQAHAQLSPLTPLSRSDAVRAAIERGARLPLAQADSALAYAQLLTARAFENPTLSTIYSKSTPQYHVTIDVPIAYPWIRRGKIRSALAARTAAQYRFQLERAMVALAADTAYTRVLAARAHAVLSRRNAQDADSLRRMAVSRRAAGDASDLDVELATVSAGQEANTADADSLAYLSALLDLQTVIGLAAGRVEVMPTDSLIAPPADTAAPFGNAASFSGLAPGVTRVSVDSGGRVVLTGSPLQIAAAEAAYASAQLAANAERRSIFASPSIMAGFETGDPSGSEPGLLPTFGLSLPLPLFNRNRGPIAQVEAERQRARAELALAQLESRTEIARAIRERDIALAKVSRDQILVAGANRVAAMSLTAYREGASALPNVLEARRNARDVLGRYIDDLADAWIADAELRVLLLTPTNGANR